MTMGDDEGWWSGFKTNHLFRPGPIGDLNACVGDNGGPYDFDDYAWGYIDAGNALVLAAAKREVLVDLVVYPVVYCYRHGIELWLKHLARVLPPLWDEDVAVRHTHKLRDNWHAVRCYLARDAEAFDPKAIPFLEVVIEHLIDFDANGEVFRFPESRDGTPHLGEARIINLDVLRQVMTVAGEELKNIGWTISGMYEYRAQRAAEQQ